jgi:hypothetical protein
MGFVVHVAAMAHHSSFFIVKGHSKSLSQSDTDLVPTVLIISVPTWMEPSVFSERM